MVTGCAGARRRQQAGRVDGLEAHEPRPLARRRAEVARGRGGQRADADRDDDEIHAAAVQLPVELGEDRARSPRPPGAGPPRSRATRCRRSRGGARRPARRRGGPRRRSRPSTSSTLAPSASMAWTRVATLPSVMTTRAASPRPWAARATARPWLPSVAHTSVSPSRVRARAAPAARWPGRARRSARRAPRPWPTMRRGP